MKTTLEKRLAAIEGAAAGAHPQLIEIPEWLNWATCDELTRLEQVFRDAAAAMSDELGEADQHRVMAEAAAVSA